ncbi:MAG: Xaa-Pro peptidase family protein [Actinobacteria bacterium]|nr:Xaa-Pro peptidase family protein [Actinomycetota bacterium]
MTTAADLVPMDVAGRAGRLRSLLADVGCDALVVTHMANIRYLTGFTGSAGLLVVDPEALVLVTDGRYRDQASEQLAVAGVDARVEMAQSAAAQREVLATVTTGVTRLGLEADHVSWSAQRRYALEWWPGTELVATEGLVERLRQHKDGGEIARMARASAIADAALAKVRPRLAERPTEAEVALELDSEVRRLGADGPGFETIVASGPNGARPHARPGRRRIVEGDLVVIDFGAMVEGYRSDMTRTTMVGEPTPTQRRMLDVVARSQAAGVATVGAGVAAAEVDRACRSVIAQAGWEDAFLHGTGHGVGLDIHEDPRVGRTSTATLDAGHVVTVAGGMEGRRLWPAR